MSMTTVEELRGFMAEEADRLRKGDSTPANANAVANLAGKILSSVKMELEYNKMVGSSPKIDFLTSKNESIKKLEKKQ